MTWISSFRTPTGYVVLEFPRGPELGRVLRVDVRRWRGECPDCGSVGDGRTRPHAAAILANHNRAAHLAKPPDAPLPEESR
jgi:hypothetical protein